METVRSGDCAIPALGLGTWLLAGEDCLRAVPIALELGYTHFDTAQAYDNEAEIGRAIADVERDRLFLTTKLSNDSLHPDGVVTSTEGSLRALRTDYVDLLLIHWPVQTDILPATLDAMRGLVERGVVRHLGVSNFTVEQVDEALRHAPIVTNQVEHHVYLAQDALHAQAVEHDLFLTAYAPLARGQVLDDPVLGEIAEERGATPGQVALRYLLDLGQEVVVPKATSREHLSENLAALAVTLSDEDRARIAGLDRSHRLVDPPFAPAWDVA